ncbi:hypothetical protein ACFPMF_04220 [Larkinella bovis]|uniref:Uncharacterized protein n=1 Tax=Larkinella bovis TaxID=683041 RepID=A0ABW0I7J5_9BACT
MKRFYGLEGTINRSTAGFFHLTDFNSFQTVYGPTFAPESDNTTTLMNKDLKIIPSALGLALGLCWIIVNGGASHDLTVSKTPVAGTTKIRPTTASRPAMPGRDTLQASRSVQP